VSAFDAAIELARRGRGRFRLLLEALARRGRARAGEAGEGSGGGRGLHWDYYGGEGRMSEMVGRMQGPRDQLERLSLLA
jgi:hypothetical protein